MISYKGYTGVFEYDETIDALAGYVVDIAGEIYFEGRSRQLGAMVPSMLGRAALVARIEGHPMKHWSTGAMSSSQHATANG